MNGGYSTAAIGGRSRFGGRASLPLHSGGRGHQSYTKGQIVYDSRVTHPRPAMIVVGEVVIVRGGRAVDILEPGEYLDPSIWERATAIAWTDCRLMNAV